MRAKTKLAVCCTIAALAGGTATVIADRVGGQVALTSSKSTALGGIVLTPCSRQVSNPIGIVGRLKPGHLAAELEGRGYAVQAPGGLGSAVPANPSLITIAARRGDGHAADSSVLQHDPALAAAGNVLAQSSDPKLKSCNYKGLRQ